MQSYPKPFTFAFSIVMTLAVLLVLGVGHGLRAGEAPGPQAVLGIDDFMKNIDRYRGKVTLEGVVSAVDQEQQAISLVDSAGYKLCGTTACPMLLNLPVQWRGPMPAVNDTVRIKGQAQKVKGKLIFVADKLEKVVP